MQLHPVDVCIIAGYLILTIVIGIWVSKLAARNLDSYFLGGKQLPWWVLGVSNASGMFDITGTMWLVYICFVYGLKGAFLPWQWPVFNQIFLMVYLSAWLRRSNVLTGAEWIKTRFGTGTGSNLAHISVVVFALVSVIGFLAYAFKGIGKFADIFLPWDLAGILGLPMANENLYAFLILSITTVYVVSGGMYSVVLTELLQFIIMTIASLAVGIIAINQVSPAMLEGVLPEGWGSLFFGWRLDLDWTAVLPAANDKIADDGYSLFTIFFIMMCFKGILVSAAGPAPNYDMQRILATRSPKEASLMSGLVTVVLFFPRYMLIAGLTVLAFGFFMPQLQAMGGDLDFEQLLPFVIRDFLPIGLKGLLIAGLLAAFMSTFAATVNAAPAYIVNDIYKRFINPHASNKTYIWLSYIFSLVFVILGILFGFVGKSINDITLWIISMLWGGYAAPNILKWYWWRFNGYGFFWGMIFGIAAAVLAPILNGLLVGWGLIPKVHDIYQFPWILLVSTIGCIVGSLLTQPDTDETLKHFYKKVRPWGFWGPVHEMVKAEDPHFEGNNDFYRDCFNILVGIIWQLGLVVLPIYLCIHDHASAVWAVGVIVITSLILKYNWLDKLPEE
ncbi:sodium:solute symporter [bacterium]|nr:sodium:solute symporter [bacterium]